MNDPKLRLGTRYCLCRSCGRCFGGVNGFDMHRIGPMEARICLDPAALLDKHGRRRLWPNERGYWVGDAIGLEVSSPERMQRMGTSHVAELPAAPGSIGL